MVGRLPARQRRAAILESAAALFAGRGFSGVTTRELSVAAGVSEAMLYKHFPDKEALYGALLERHLEDVERAIPLDGLAASKLPPERFFTEIGGTLLRGIEEDPTLIRLMFYSALEGHPLARDFERARARRLRDAIADYLRRLRKRGGVRPLDPDVAARSFVWLIAGFGLSRVLFREPGALRVPRPVLVRRIVRQFLTGILPAFALAAVLGGCATPSSPLEAAMRAPVPLVRDAAPSAAPAVLPESGARIAADILDAARRRGTFTLEDCIRSAMATREDLVSGDEDRLQALLVRDRALAGILPEIRTILRHDRRDPVRSSGNSSATDPARTEWLVNVTQPLFQGFRQKYAMLSAESTADALAEDVADLRRFLAISVSRAFMLTVESDAEIGALEEALRLDDERVLEIRARTEQGLARRTEVLLQESRRESTRAAVFAARERRDASRVLLETLSGTRIDLPLDPGPAASAAAVPGRDEAIAEAVRRRPDLRAAERRALAADYNRKIASADRWPTVGAEGNWYLDKWSASGSTARSRWDLGIFVDFPLFLGGAIEANERAADSRARQAALDRSAVLRDIVSEVDAALVRLSAGLERMESFRSNLRFARENLSLLLEEYRLGLATNLEVFTAQIQQQDAAVGLERQEYQSRLDRIELHLVMGREESVGAVPATPKEKR